MSGDKKAFMMGNEAIVEGAIRAGCLFYAGYPITPSSEIAERFSWRLLEVGGTFIQMEDELSSVSALIGSTFAGKKCMTATSGPGFCLMQENLGCATIMEAPIIIVDVQRPGPGGGLATTPAQGDLMQAKWGRNGDQKVIVISPASVQECYNFTIKAFNLSEQFRVPVIILADEFTGHLRENLVIPDKVEIFERRTPTCPPEEFGIFKPGPDGVPDLPNFGGDYIYDVTSISHNIYGDGSPGPDGFDKLVRRLGDKLEDNIEDITVVNKYYDENDEMDTLIITFGCMTRPSREAARRSVDKKLGVLQLGTLSPFPLKEVKEAAAKAKNILVAELNLGQLHMEIDRHLGKDKKVYSLGRNNGIVITPSEILEFVREVVK